MSIKPPISYIQRTRSYYLALGYDNPYAWAAFDAPAFMRPTKPLKDMTIALVVTAAPYKKGAGDQGPGAPYNGGAKFFDVWSMPITPLPNLRISHIAIDRDHTTAADMASFAPIKALLQTAKDGIIGGVTKNVFGFPTNRSQRTNIEKDAPALGALLAASGCDAVVFVPNCPVCHQSVAIAARHIEQMGLPTVIMGCAKDIIEQARVPRFMFSDFPLGNAAGKPHDVENQRQTLSYALDMLISSSAPETTFINPAEWAADHAWKDDYSNPDKLTPAMRAERRAAFDAAKNVASSVKKGVS